MTRSELGAEVRNVRDGKDLIIAGAQQSRFQPGAILTGETWDVLALARYAAPRRECRALMLGVGGGTVVRIMRHQERSIQADQIWGTLRWKWWGVDHNTCAIQAAKEHFAIDELGFEGSGVANCDAAEYLGGCAAGTWDVIIDDCFDGPRKPGNKNAILWEAMRALAEDGLLVVNAVTYEDRFYRYVLCGRYPSIVNLRLKGFANSIYFASKSKDLTAERLGQQIARLSNEDLLPRVRRGLQIMDVAPRTAPPVG